MVLVGVLPSWELASAVAGSGVLASVGAGESVE